MYILGVWGEIRELCLRFDMVSFSFIDNVYDLFIKIATQDLLTTESMKNIVNNFYVVVCLFAFFRIAILLINSIISPDALNQKGAGLSKIFTNLVIMIVLLIITPQLFSMSRELTKEIVNGNYIQKLILNANDVGKEPGYDMQRIAISAIIVPEDKYIIDMNNLTIKKSECSGDCEKAINCLKEIKGNLGVDVGTECTTKDGNVKWSKLVEYNGVQTGMYGSKVYVYNYKPLILTILGWTITYILLSFTFDAGKRLIELAILEILSPLFIATIVDPKSMKSGPFNKWLKAVGSSYLSLFLRIGAVAIIILCVRLLMGWESIGAFATLIVMLSVLIFAKGFPKWISNMIGIDGDGTGLGSLGIGKKLAGAALIGGGLTKAGHAAAGAARGAAELVHRNNQNRRALKKETRDKLGYKRGLTSGARNARKETFNKLKDSDNSYAKMSQRAALRKAKSDAYKELGVGKKDSLKQAGAALFTGAITGGKVGLNANDMKDVLSSAKDASKKEADYLAMTKKSGTKVGDWVRDLPKTVEGAFGNPNELYKKRKDIADAKNAVFHSGGRYQAGYDKGKIVEGMGDATILFKEYGATTSSEALLAQYCKTNGLDKGAFDRSKGFITTDAGGNICCNIDGNAVNLNDSLYIKGTGGVENLSKMFNAYQTNALTNSSYAQEQYMQQATAYQGAINTQNNVAQQAQALASALKSSLPDALKDISIDSSSMFGIKKGVNDMLEALKDKDKYKINDKEETALYQKLKELSNLSSSYDTSLIQAETIKGGMETLKSTIENLSPIVDNISGGTKIEKEQTLSQELSKLEKTLEGIKKPSDDKK